MRIREVFFRTASSNEETTEQRYELLLLFRQKARESNIPITILKNVIITSVIAQCARTCSSLSISERTRSHRVYLDYGVQSKEENVTFIFVKYYVSFIFVSIISDDVEYQDLPITKPYPQFLAYCHNCGDT